MRSQRVTLPNIISASRLALAPLLIAFAITEQRTPFIVFLCVSFVSDVVDGLIARSFNQCTKLGARLDSAADELTYIAAVVGVFQFEYEVIRSYGLAFYLFLILLFLATIFPIVKFRATSSYHLYSFKANALFQALFFLDIFVFGFHPYLYYFVMMFGICACLESLAVTLVLDQPMSNVKSLYRVLSDKKSGAG